MIEKHTHGFAQCMPPLRSDWKSIRFIHMHKTLSAQKLNDCVIFPIVPFASAFSLFSSSQCSWQYKKWLDSKRETLVSKATKPQPLPLLFQCFCKSGHFSLFSSVQYSWQYKKWLDSKRGPLVSKATTLPTVLQPLPLLFQCLFVKRWTIKLSHIQHFSIRLLNAIKQFQNGLKRGA